MRLLELGEALERPGPDGRWSVHERVDLVGLTLFKIRGPEPVR